MLRSTLVLAALAVNAAAGPCRPATSSTELLSTTIGLIETSYETSFTEETSTAAGTETTDFVPMTIVSIASSEATTTAEVAPTSDTEPTTTSVDGCVASLTGGSEPRLTDRIGDCQDFNVVTVSSYAVTQTAYKRGNVIIIPTNAIRRRAEGDAATTILPTGMPDYATYCDGPSAYYDACSAAFSVTAFTTTIPEPTTTEIIITN